MKTLVLGLGNYILSDDSVGLCVAQELRKVLDQEEITITEACVGGLRLLDLMVGYDKAIIIDAIQTRGGKVGQIYRLNSNAFNTTRRTTSTHNVNLTSALKIGRQLGLVLPQKIIVFAIEVADVNTFSEECTSEVKEAIPECVGIVAKELNTYAFTVKNLSML
jgi:hydrogenase maturation protease